MSEPTPEPASAPAAATTTRASTTKAGTAKTGTAKTTAKVSTAKAGSSAPAVAQRSAEATAPLKVHHLRPAKGAHTARTRVGRGEASKGKTAGRGTKGTSARYQVSAAFEGGQMPLHMRLPKLRGFTNPFKVEHQVVNLDRLTELFPDGGAVGVEQLVAAGAVRKGERVKVLGTGEAGVALDLTVHAASASAEAKVTAAGGSITRL